MRGEVATLLSLLFAGVAMAQTAELTERLGRTVLYEEVAISADGKRVAWVQTTATTSPKITFVAAATAGSKAKAVSLDIAGERFDSGLAWSPDSRTLGGRTSK